MLCVLVHSAVLAASLAEPAAVRLEHAQLGPVTAAVPDGLGSPHYRLTPVGDSPHLFVVRSADHPLMAGGRGRAGRASARLVDGPAAGRHHGGIGGAARHRGCSRPAPVPPTRAPAGDTRLTRGDRGNPIESDPDFRNPRRMTMKRMIPASLAVALVLALAGTAAADIPRQINFQGRLADSAGTPLTGSYSVAFRIFDASAAGTACHNASQTVSANSGLFNVSIGAGTGIAAACNFSRPYWLEIQVGTDSPMSPRIPLTSAAYAFTASALAEPGTNTVWQAGNQTGRIPVSNGTVNANLNADMLDGKHDTYFAPAHGHPYSLDTHNHRGSPRYTCNAGSYTCGKSSCSFSPAVTVPSCTGCPTSCTFAGYLHN